MDTNESDYRGQVDVIIPAFQASATIERAMESVRIQGDVVNQVFIVDNASTDDTSEVVRAYIEKHELENWRLMHERQAGAPAARNHPLSFVTASWIQFLDADDELLEGKLSKQLAQWEFTEGDVLVGAARHVDSFLQITEKQPLTEVRSALISGRCGNTCSNLFRSKCVKSVGGWDEQLSSSQEYDLMFRIWEGGGRFLFDSTPSTVIHEAESGRITTSNLPKKWINHCAVQHRMMIAFKKTDDSACDFNEWLQAHFSCLRILYQHHPEKALEFWRAKEFQGFIPEVNATNTAAYVKLFRLLGFEGAERVRTVFRKLKK